VEGGDMKITLGTKVKVTLNEVGVEALEGSYEYLMEKSVKLGENNEVTMTMEQMMNIFRRKIREKPFVDDEIEILEDEK
jgi:hypothetical protein